MNAAYVEEEEDDDDEDEEEEKKEEGNKKMNINNSGINNHCLTGGQEIKQVWLSYIMGGFMLDTGPKPTNIG